jgi:ABC-2 type transport system permease protein
MSAVLILYAAVIVSMYDPSLKATLDSYIQMMPEIMKAAGMSSYTTNLTGFVSNYMYGFLLLVFPMIFSIICANRLLALLVDRGSISYLLASPVKRITIAFTQMKVLCTGIFTMIFLFTLIIGAICEASFPGELDIAKFMLLNIGILCLQLFIGGICFLSSCICNSTKYSLAFGAGIPLFEYVLQMAINMNNNISGLKYATFFTLFNAEALGGTTDAAPETWAIVALGTLFLGAAALFSAGITVFCKKDLHV